MAPAIRYMGSKRSLAPRIARLITRRHPTARVVDAFAGTCAIGTALAKNHAVTANDAHAFAALVARVLLVTPGTVPTPNEALDELRPSFRRNWVALFPWVESRLAMEQAALAKESRPGGWRSLMDFTLAEHEHSVPRSTPWTREDKDAPAHLFSSYFASSYFGIKQCAEIDCLRWAIEAAPSPQRDFYMLALLHAVSHCAAAPGHFAQFLVPRDRSNTNYIARIRRRSVLDRFREALAEFWLPPCLNRTFNAAFCQDATQFVASLSKTTPTVIYADPPYSRAQYSRYYHVLETLVLYDYPSATGKGRYRGDRFQTDFSRTAGVERAMDEFAEASAATGCPLYLSYPTNGLLHLAGVDVRDLLKRHYAKVETAISVTLSHSTLGGAPGEASIDVLENVYYARRA